MFDMIYAVGIAISPTPIVLVILLLLGARGNLNALGYFLGWVAGLILLGATVFVLVFNGLFLVSVQPGLVRPYVDVLLSILLFWVAFRQWTKPVELPSELTEPKWMKTADRLTVGSTAHITPLRAFFLAIIMSAVSPKNIALMFAAMISFVQQNVTGENLAIVFAFFVFIGSITIGIPVGYALLNGDGARELLNRWKTWILSNSHKSVALLIGMVAFVAFFNGVSGMAVNFQGRPT